MNRFRCRSTVALVALAVATNPSAVGMLADDGPIVRFGDPVPRDVREMYDAGLRYLLKTQDSSGGWQEQFSGPGVTGMGTMVLLASGEDPNYGPYREPIRKAIRYIISSQDAATGFLGGQAHPSMYQHGFAMLALAEAYGVVDDRMLWPGGDEAGSRRSIGQALELAVRCAVTSAKENPTGAWRYAPNGKDADTSVAGAVMMGLLAARNAGIEVPDETIDRALRYFESMTGVNGQLGYSGQRGGGSDAVTSVGVLVFAIAGKKDLPQYQAALKYLVARTRATGALGEQSQSYTSYYRAQALFQGDVDEWEAWNVRLVNELRQMQSKDGSFSNLAARGGYGTTVDTALALLSLAVNYKLLPVYER